MNQTKIHDITLPLYPGMVVYPGDPPFVLKQQNSLLNGDDFNLSSLSLGSHTGTHLDAHSHYCFGGSTVEEISLEDLMGSAKVIEVNAENAILPEHLANRGIRQGDRILFKTCNSLLPRETFQTNFVHLSPETAEFLVQKKVRLVGIDYFSIDGYAADGASHKILLGGNVVILEGVDLKNVPEGDYVLLALPLKIRGCDGSPVRAVLIERGIGVENE